MNDKKYPPREGDLPREELCRRAQMALDEWGEGTQILFKFTCEHCGERCTFQEPNQLYENGECFACGQSTPIKFGGFAIRKTLTHEKEN